MSDNSKAGTPPVCGPSCGGKCRTAWKEGVLSNNPIIMQVIGICSCLAVTGRVQTALVMGAALVFVTALSNLFVSALRDLIPRRIRMVAEVAIIATFVIVFDQLLRAFYWDMSKQLGPYVGLIITNCIVMGRAEAFAIQNKPLVSFVDGIANGVGYALVLLLVALIREPLGSGTLLGFTVFSPSWYEKNLVFVLAPGAFFTAGCLIWAINAMMPPKPKETKK